MDRVDCELKEVNCKDFVNENERPESPSKEDLAKMGDQSISAFNESYEKVDHPKHYNMHPSGIECIEIIRHMNFNIGNAIKYLWRSGLKDSNSDIQDLKKAIWYIYDEIKRLEAKEESSA